MSQMDRETRRFAIGLLAAFLVAHLAAHLAVAAIYGEIMYDDWRCGMPKVECRIEKK